MKVAMISTFKTQCGVAQNLDDLGYELSKVCNFKVFAGNIVPPQTEVGVANIKYERCWTPYTYDKYDKLLCGLLEFNPDIVHIQFVAGVFNELFYPDKSPFQDMISTIGKTAKIVLTLHDLPSFSPQLQNITQWYKRLNASYIILNPYGEQHLRQWIPEGRIYTIPIGTQNITYIDMAEARQKLGLQNEDFILTQFGCYGIDKGMQEIIEAIPKIDIPNFKMAFAGGFHKLADPGHFPYVRNCIKTSIKLNLQNKIIFVNKYLDEKEIDLWIAATNFIILNQHIFHPSSSGSAHRILLGRKPIIMSQNQKLSEFEDYKQCIKTPPDKIAETITMLYNNKELQKQIIEGAYTHGKETTWDKIAKRHMEVYEKCFQ